MSGAAAEPRETRLKRMRMRSWRRGMKEMDLILGRFADRELAGMSEVELDAYDALLSELDPELYAWVSGRSDPPAAHAALVARLRRLGADEAAG